MGSPGHSPAAADSFPAAMEIAFALAVLRMVLMLSSVRNKRVKG